MREKIGRAKGASTPTGAGNTPLVSIEGVPRGGLNAKVTVVGIPNLRAGGTIGKRASECLSLTR
jgi:hypothetical protein